MINHRHMEQIDETVRLGRRVITTQRVHDFDGSSAALHERWYLGLTSQQAGVPASRALRRTSPCYPSGRCTGSAW
jgi:hypothetical protein